MNIRILSFFVTTLISFSVFAAPGIPVGKTAPDFKIKTAENKDFHFYSELKDSNYVLLFYRGGWCPYCNIQLKAVNNSIIPKLKGKNVKLIAISVDKISETAKTKEKLNFPVASDSKAQVISLYNIVNKVDDKTNEKLKGWDIDIEKASGYNHHKIAIPAVFLVNKDKKIVFSYANENYKVRAQNKDILKAIESLK